MSCLLICPCLTISSATSVSLYFSANTLMVYVPAVIGFISYSPFSLAFIFTDAASITTTAPLITELFFAFVITSFKVVAVFDGSIIIRFVLYVETKSAFAVLEPTIVLSNCSFKIWSASFIRFFKLVLMVAFCAAALRGSGTFAW